MHRCNHNLKGCLTVSAFRVGRKVSVSASNIGDGIKVSVKPIDKRVVVSCSLICTINNTPYLNVNPDYVWLTPDILSSGEFDIISNVDWNIV